MTRPDMDGSETVGASTFTASIRALSVELGTPPHTATELNRITGRLDQLGRRLHGLEWINNREIGGCLTEAVSELRMAQGLPRDTSASAVRRAIVQLDAALTFADEGVRRVSRTSSREEIPAAGDSA